ncbi:MAG TPA: DUF998 domain-containing protein [Anaerolineae bacterium]|nr:DUF998 domain-containing protein [Anaerolineae bacterium]
MSIVDSQPNRMVRYLSAAGIVGPLLYTGAWLVLGFLDPAYSHVRDPISDLSAIGAPYAPIMTFIIFVFAILTVAFAFGLHLGLPRGFWVGPAALVIAGIGYVGIALAPLDLADPGDDSVPHTIAASITVFALMLAPVLHFPRLRRDTSWRNLGRYSVATTVAAFAFAFLASLPAFEGWEGLMQRLVLLVVLVWMIVIATRLYLRSAPGSAEGQ